MKSIQGDIWDFWRQGKTIAITTNGFVKTDNRAVMGRGVAKQALEIVDRNLDKRLGALLIEFGNVPHMIAPNLITFPVKTTQGLCQGDKLNVVPHMRNRYEYDDIVPGWALMADLWIIGHSMSCLDELHERGFVGDVWMPKPGCGAGGLKWEDVKPEMAWVGDWLTVCDLKP